MKLDNKQTWDIAQKHRYSLKIQNAMGFSDMNIVPPDIDFYEDYDQYFNSGTNIIHIGAYGITENFNVESEEDFLEALTYIRGHEEEHCRSTSHRPYAIGIQKGCEEVLKYISSKEDKVPRRFRTPADFENYANHTLPSMGIYISWQHVMEIVGGIANSLEDGRIERIRSIRYPGFDRLRIKFRGIYWSLDKEKFSDYEDIKDNQPEKLRIILNQILMLSTCQLYQKGFAMKYQGSLLKDEVDSFMPYIGRAIIAGSCREMSKEVVEISRLLAPYIYETCKMSYKDMSMRKMLEDMIRKLIEASVENNIFAPGGNLSENDEKKEENTNPKSTFPVSDLVITLPDEVYDKLPKTTGEGEGSIVVKREHPKEEDEPQKSGSSSESGKSGSNGDYTSKDDENTSGSGSSDREESTENGSQDSTAEHGSSTSSEDNGEKTGETAAESESVKGTGLNGERINGSGRGSSENSSDNIDEVLSAMKKAAEQTREEAKETISNINSHIAHEHRTREEIPDKEPPLSEADMAKEIGHRFKEVKRAYKVTDKLPPVLQARGRAMFRKNQRYFKSLSKPTVKNLDSGSVDPGKIYGLSFGDTEVFQKTGTDKQFDGCAYMLIDNSGSMCGNKRIESAKAGAVIEEGFRKMFPLKIVAFDEDGPIIHEVIKNWDEWLGQNCCWNYALHGREGCGNEDGYDIRVATRELLARPEKKKMLVVLSDGAPGSRSLVNKAVKDARKKGIEVYSIYFEEGAVGQRQEEIMKQMYERDYVVCPLDELDEHLNKLFKKFSRS